MTFDARDLRRGKDVFGADGTYLGTVVWIKVRPPDPGRRADLSGGADRPLPGVAAVCASGDPASAFSGEALGPMPTAALGNGGPARQSAASAFGASAARLDAPGTMLPVELLVMRLLTALSWSTLRPRVWRIPVDLVQAVSHERIVLSITAPELESRRSPSP